jgi:hypothetical protein
MNTWEQLHLIKKYLSLLQSIPDMALYAEIWRLLGMEYLIIGAFANADYCQARAEHYSQETGEYIRLIELPFAELIQVPAVQS